MDCSYSTPLQRYQWVGGTDDRSRSIHPRGYLRARTRYSGRNRERYVCLRSDMLSRTENQILSPCGQEVMRALSKRFPKHIYWPHQSPISLHNGQTARIIVQMGENGVESAEISVDPHSDLAIYHSPSDEYTKALKRGLENGTVDKMSSMCSTLPDH